MTPLRWPLKTLFALALLLRLLPVLATRSDEIVPSWPVALNRDGVGYASYAENLWRGRGYREDTGDRSHRAPAYPAFLALTFVLGGYQFLLARMAQAALGALACWLLYRLARSAWGEEAGRGAFLASAVYLPFLFFSPQIENVTLYVALIAATLAALVWAAEGEAGRAVVPGIGLGLSALTAGTVLAAAPVLALWLAWRRRSLLPAAVLTAATVAILAPWAAWNWKVHGSFVLIDTNSGGVLFLGNVNYPYWVDDRAPDALEQVRRTTGYDGLDEIGKDRLLRSLATDWIRAHPGEFLRRWFLKLLHAVNPWPSGKPWQAGVASLATYGLALAAGLWGAWRALRERSPAGILLVGYLVSVACVHAVFVVAQRHRVPLLDPVWIVLGASLLRRRP